MQNSENKSIIKANRKTIAQDITDKKGFPFSESKRLTDAFFNIIIDALKNGHSVKLSKFGTFKVSSRKAKKGRNPITGEEIMLDAHKTVSFKAGKWLREYINR